LEAYYSFITDGTKCVTFKTQITGGRIKMKKILEIELKADNELNSQEYEKHILELELQSKSSEVTGKSLSIAKQSEMIESIQGILDSEIDLNKLKSELKETIKSMLINTNGRLLKLI
jgi:hypothetical protein